MKQKQKITEEIKFDIRKNVTHRYRPPITLGDIMSTEGIEKDDVLLGYEYEQRERSGFGAGLDGPEYYDQAVVFVERTRWETDEEFELRLEREGRMEKDKRDHEYQEYLRLKGLFEPNGR